MGCDNVLSSTVVLADGQIVTASESECPDLSWAIKGVCLDTRLALRWLILIVKEDPPSSAL